jgi:hypothetical protein
MSSGRMASRGVLCQTGAAALALGIACGGTDAVGASQTTSGAPQSGDGTSESSEESRGGMPSMPEPGVYQGRYVVPVPEDLAAYAQYEIEQIEIRIREGEMELRYRMPVLLVGNSRDVSFRGDANAAGNYSLEGDNGSATCGVRDGGFFRCDEALRDMEPDAQKIAEALSALPEPEASGRRAVSDRFAIDPIGVLSFDMTP